MISIENLAMHYGAKLLFTEVNLNLSRNNRYGLVGANGAGKSTFFKLMSGDEHPSDGSVKFPKGTRIGVLRQDQYLFENISVINSVIAGRKELWSAIQEKEKLLELESLDEKSGYRIAELEHIIMDNDGYTADTFAAELLDGLGIKEKYHHEPLSCLSGGYKLRVLLAQSLFNNPDILLLDEPTNHLDINSIYWLENYLREEFKGLLVFISHDVSFLNNLPTHILDIDYGEIRQYTGNYNRFSIEKIQVAEQKAKELSNAEKKIASMQSFVDKFKAGTRSRQAKSKEKQMDRIELPDIQKSSRISPYFRFKQKRPSGKIVVKLENISKSYDDQKVLNKVNFNVQKGEKVVIIGPNGIGKSTLLKIIMGKTLPNTGSYEWGYEPQISYFAQDHHELLNESIKVIDWISNYFADAPVSQLRSVLGQVLFKQDQIEKNILDLSGGEAARLLIAKTMLEEPNILILDEPTNHLDIEAVEALRDGLIDYSGTVILVTHDRNLASAVATRVIALTSRGMTDFKGKYEDYLEKNGMDYLNR